MSEYVFPFEKLNKKYYWAIVFLLLVGVLIGAACWTYQVFVGIGVGGQNNPVAWGTYLINFVFWVGIAHSGTLISAILHLFRAGWRNPIARAAETMTVFAVCIAGLFPFIHLGRVWQVYYMIPLPNQRLLWPNFLSPLMFDVIAISTYLTVSSLFWYTGLLPDLAAVRDRSTGTRYKIFKISLYPRVSFFCSPGNAAGYLRPQRGVLGFCPEWYTRLAHHHLCALLCGRCHSFRPGNGADLDDSPAQTI